MRLYFTFDVSRCSGCMACAVACQDENDLAAGKPGFRVVSKKEKGAFPKAAISFISMACRHCAEAPCIQACPSEALYRRPQDGIVLVDPEQCVGCHTCEEACPFGSARFVDDGRMAKCHFCVDRLDRGLDPACVRVCHTKALGFGSLERILDQPAVSLRQAAQDKPVAQGGR